MDDSQAPVPPVPAPDGGAVPAPDPSLPAVDPAAPAPDLGGLPVDPAAPVEGPAEAPAAPAEEVPPAVV